MTRQGASWRHHGWLMLCCWCIQRTDSRVVIWIFNFQSLIQFSLAYVIGSSYVRIPNPNYVQLDWRTAFAMSPSHFLQHENTERSSLLRKVLQNIFIIVQNASCIILLRISTASAKKLKLTLRWNCFYNYDCNLLQPINLDLKFPFFEMSILNNIYDIGDQRSITLITITSYI